MKYLLFNQNDFKMLKMPAASITRCARDLHAFICVEENAWYWYQARTEPQTSATKI